MNISHGVMDGGTPNGDKASLERLAAQVNERARQEYLAKCRQWKQQQEALKTRENKSAR